MVVILITKILNAILCGSNPKYSKLTLVAKTIPNIFPEVEYALSLLKVCDTYLRLPLVEPNDKVKQKLKELIKKY